MTRRMGGRGETSRKRQNDKELERRDDKEPERRYHNDKEEGECDPTQCDEAMEECQPAQHDDEEEGNPTTTTSWTKASAIQPNTQRRRKASATQPNEEKVECELAQRDKEEGDPTHHNHHNEPDKGQCNPAQCDEEKEGASTHHEEEGQCDPMSTLTNAVSGSNYVWSEVHFMPYPSPHTYLLQTPSLPLITLPPDHYTCYSDPQDVWTLSG